MDRTQPMPSAAPRERWNAKAVPYAVAAVLAVFAADGIWSLPYLVRSWGVPMSALPVGLTWLALVAAPILLARHGRWLAAIGTAAIGSLAMRIGLALLANGRVWPGDAGIYLELAASLRDGHGLAFFEPFMGVETRALFPPLYPALLAAWSLIAGLSTASLVVLNILTDAATAWLIVLLARALGRPRAGMLSAWLYLVWPSVLLSAPLAQKEGLCALLAVLLALRWVRYAGAERPGVGDAAVIGALSGLLALTQPGQLPLAGLFGLVALGRGARRLATMLAVGPPAAALVMAPWWIRNALLFQAFVPLTSAGGYSLWIGNNPRSTGAFIAPPIGLRGLPELLFGREAGRIAMAWIEAHPVGFVRVTLVKALRAWSISEWGATRFTVMAPPLARADAAPLFVTAHVAHVAMLGTAALRAAFRSGPATRTIVLLVFACLVQTLCFGALFEFGERHREFATPFLLLLGCWGVHAKGPPASLPTAPVTTFEREGPP